uniref:Uncharacterized protein n=1 Tax=Anguilla anguilla TaxID=7936 RepID=A0A0E9S1K8_ANGAN
MFLNILNLSVYKNGSGRPINLKRLVEEWFSM